MGAVVSSLEEHGRKMREKDMEDFLERLNDGMAPDLRVDKRIVMFSGLWSSDNLRKHYEKRKREAGGSAEDLIKTIAGKLGEYIPASALGGLGPLAIAVLIDLASFSPPEESTKDALRSVFAEEKASDVWDQIDECLKRCVMHINNDHDLATDIRRIECRLSAAITKLKNSMVRDGHMSSLALKAWVNGAAFHIQMLIHLVRLGGTQTCDPVETLLSTYLRDLDTLFIKHREMVEAKCSMNPIVVYQTLAAKILRDEDLNLGYKMSTDGDFDEYFEAYYDHRYNRQKTDIKRYFCDVRDNLQTLVDQRGYFNV
ncbi:uncharacterized protein LOC116693114 [Etheostoma spectabile]|uniref:Uncharacterized protein n=1 Tax=Etheostoma spectabile TaxID=54343 RepID=A0A5J5D9M2_9PERO|nr:uncharacterized protein LOC116693114 [Etheostoma spectabile]XP_032377722.1 uncharacterized protein LOC116693114 [Etheostoma spectabile]KAA8591408.1 hypothetical protein FQN60_002351 [Etheostoma spectabile]